MTYRNSTSYFAAIISLVLLAGPVHAANLLIQDHSFENEPTINVLPSAWDAYNPNGVTAFFGTYPPTTTSDFYHATSPVSVPPDGEQVGYVYLSSTFGQGPVGFAQTLSSNLMANSHYELSVAVGNLATALSPRSNNFFDYEGFPGYIVQLLAGDRVVAEDINSIAIAEGEFEEITLSLAVGDTLEVMGDNLIGLTLGIRLLNQNTDLSSAFPPQLPPAGANQDPNTPVGWNSEVDFDNVQLSVTIIPLPSSLWLFGTALLGFVYFSRRRRPT